eukprot:TRINITY_DN2494_c0_g1_i1.p1 TRINITY_DN2494_c0_g1~~TRINITY_DN2494_c0_g1_i1.p1  ORF type:complete len:109 (+),score=27.12 TRINITY_DN2494_c0_g1_i1:150-476(+)
MNDLLRTRSGYSRFNGDSGGGGGNFDDELERVVASSTDARLHKFFGEVSQIQSRMNAVKQKLNDLKQVNDDSKRVTKAADIKGQMLLSANKESDNIQSQIMLFFIVTQ